MWRGSTGGSFYGVGRRRHCLVRVDVGREGQGRSFRRGTLRILCLPLWMTSWSLLAAREAWRMLLVVAVPLAYWPDFGHRCRFRSRSTGTIRATRVRILDGFHYTFHCQPHHRRGPPGRQPIRHPSRAMSTPPRAQPSFASKSLPLRRLRADSGAILAQDALTELSTAEINSIVPPHPIYKIVMTGGPCGGKTTCLERLSNYLRERGFEVITW